MRLGEFKSRYGRCGEDNDCSSESDINVFLLLFVGHLKTFAVSDGRMIDEFERIRKEAIVA
jgi:hypothetical protein